VRSVGNVVLAVALCGCNAVFGVRDTVLADAAPAPDADLRLLDPSASATSCGAPLDFSSATFTLKSAQPTPEGLGTRAVAASYHLVYNGIDATAFAALYEWDQVGPPIARIPLGQTANPVGLGLSPGGEVVWYADAGGVFYARTSDWTPQVATLPAIGTYVVPGQVGYYGGTARMVVATDVGLRELSSPDGLQWTVLDTIKFANSYAGAPALSADGCILTFAQGIGTSQIFIVYRDATGSFTAAPALLPVPAGTTNAYQPTLTSDLSALWFVAADSTGMLRFVQATR
jgi:hypothetical protein